MDFRLQTAVSRPLANESWQRRGEAEIVEQRRSQLPRGEVELRVEIRRGRQAALEIRLARLPGCDLLLGAFECEPECRQLLSKLIVQVARKLRLLLLLH
jgi:hypothetical protein